MKPMLFVRVCVCVTGVLFLPGQGLAASKLFAIDSTQSSLRLTGNLSGLTVGEQGPGSLVASYSGTVMADVTETTIQFLADSTITAANTGNWQPRSGGMGGSEPANYGGQVLVGFFVARAALRHVSFNIASPQIALGAGSFPADSIEFEIPENSNAALDYTDGIQDSGTVPLAGSTTNSVLSTASITAQDGLLTITIPVDYEFELTGDQPGQFRFDGSIVATEVKQLTLDELNVNGTQLVFTFGSTPGRTYTILGSDDLNTFPHQVDQFVATETVSIRVVEADPALGRYFLLKEE